MKYGLMVFNKTRNLGDDIQSYAAMKYLPRVDYYVDRENLDQFVPDKNEMVAVIMNGWYIHNTLNWPPSPYIKPLPISMHFTTRDFWNIKEANHLTGYGLDFFKENMPIGCRDEHTVKLLSSKGIQTEFTGCLTLTIERFKDVKLGDYICAVDISKKVLEKLKEEIDIEIKEITHEMPEDYYKTPWMERVGKVEEVLKLYQGAKAVITTRLHVALPCISLNVPVLIIHDKYNDDRFKEYLEYIEHCSETEFLDGSYRYNLLDLPHNKTQHFKIQELLNNRCKRFINECEEGNEKINVPDINMYNKYIIPKSNWLKNVSFNLLNETDELSKKLLEKDENIINKDYLINKLRNNEIEITKMLKEKDIEIKQVQENLEHIENSKAWRICKKVYKVRDKIIKKK